jgi:hypothetical protein
MVFALIIYVIPLLDKSNKSGGGTPWIMEFDIAKYYV